MAENMDQHLRPVSISKAYSKPSNDLGNSNDSEFLKDCGCIPTGECGRNPGERT